MLNLSRTRTYVLFIGLNVNGVPTWTPYDAKKAVAHVFDAFTCIMQGVKGCYVYRNVKDDDNQPLIDNEQTVIALISTNKPDQITRLIKLIKRAYKQESVGLIKLPKMLFI